MAELDVAIDQIEQGPRQWPPYLGETRRYLLRRFPFFVVFRETPDRVEVLAIAHGRRRPGYWLGR
jgi:plasmid stabilization system protein ParE